MTEARDIFTHQAEIEPTTDLDGQLARLPAKWVVYLMADAQDRSVQLLCVKNLRASLKRRLGEPEIAAATRRINYRELVRKIHWRRVDSALEADWIYYESARRIFPDTYRHLVGFRPAWFIHVNPEAPFPRYIKTTDLTDRAGTYIGPLEDKADAGQLIELLEDAFDLCRYYNILTQAPKGKACAYMEMGKCPAPCDGSISLEQYRRLIDWSAKVATDPAQMIREQQARMNQAAQELRFESAAKIKAHIEQLSQLGKGAFRHTAELKDFAYVTLQRGPRQGTGKVFLVTSGWIQHIASLCAEPSRPGELLRLILESAERLPTGPIDQTGADCIGIVAHHLFLPKSTGGPFLPLRTIDDKQLLKSYWELKKQKVEAETDEEGIVKEVAGAIVPATDIPVQ